MLNPNSVAGCRSGLVGVMLATAVPIARAIGGSTSNVASGDSNFTRHSVATAWNDWIVGVADPSIKPTFASNTADATVDASGYVSRVSGDFADITITAAGINYRKKLNIFARVDTPQQDVWTSFRAGSLPKHMADAIDTRIAGKTLAAMPLYTTKDPVGGVYVRNPNCWLADMPDALTCISPWNNTGGNDRAGVAISPRHLLFTAHYPIANGATVHFVTAGNVLVTRTVTGILSHPSYVPGAIGQEHHDLQVALLNADLPASIAFARVFPANLLSYFTSLRNSSYGRVPLFRSDKEEKALVVDWQTSVGSSTGTAYVRPPTGNRAIFYEQLIGGDSGSHGAALVNGKAVLELVATTAFSGPSVWLSKTWINSAMTTLGGGYQLTEVDLSGFPTY